jgi:hypothetical protein
VPQSPASNRKGWRRLEDYCRRLTAEGKVLFIAAGPAGVGGTGSKGSAEEVGTARLKVTVPNKLWKVVVVLPRDGAQPRKNSRVIAVILPNDQSVGWEWDKYRASAREVEKLTGLRFFSRLPGGWPTPCATTLTRSRFPPQGSAGRSEHRSQGRAPESTIFLVVPLLLLLLPRRLLYHNLTQPWQDRGVVAVLGPRRRLFSVPPGARPRARRRFPRWLG